MCQGDCGNCKANYRCCLPALAGFVSPHSTGPGKESLRQMTGGFKEKRVHLDLRLQTNAKTPRPQRGAEFLNNRRDSRPANSFFDLCESLRSLRLGVYSGGPRGS